MKLLGVRITVLNASAASKVENCSWKDKKRHGNNMRCPAFNDPRDLAHKAAVERLSRKEDDIRMGKVRRSDHGYLELRADHPLGSQPRNRATPRSVLLLALASASSANESSMWNIETSLGISGLGSSLLLPANFEYFGEV